nr:SOS response-associated peptidase family protein [Stutzerimonas nitrititolerans]
MRTGSGWYRSNGIRPVLGSGERPPAINSRVETAATSRFFRDIWKTGRAIAPADGWNEWKKHPDDPKTKQPYLIRPRNDEPCFFPAIGRFQRGGVLEPRDGDGLVIITAASARA